MSVDTEIVIDEKIKKSMSLPKKYKVIFVNDDVTPIEFVINILKEVFKHTQESAENLTLSVHTEGSAVAGIYSFEIAEQKTIETINLSRASGFPLNISIEQE